MRTEFQDDAVRYFEGNRGEERLVRTVLPGGGVEHYEGNPHEERLVRTVLPDGDVLHCEGLKGEERVVRIVLPDGKVQHFEGCKGEERLQRSLFECEENARQLLQDEAVEAEREAARDASRKARNSRKRQSKKTRKEPPLQPTATTEEARPVVAVSVAASPSETTEACAPSNVEDKSTCVICIENRPDHVIVPCGHLCLCHACCSNVRSAKCPMCNGPIDRVMQVFMP